MAARASGASSRTMPRLVLGRVRNAVASMARTIVSPSGRRPAPSNGRAIASALAKEFNEAADPIHRGALIALGLVLFVLTLLVLTVSRLLIARLARGEGART